LRHNTAPDCTRRHPLAPALLSELLSPKQRIKRKTGLERAIGALRTLRVSSGGLDLLRRAA
jgi:hypothetical protein